MSDIPASLQTDWELSRRGALSRVPLYHPLYSLLKSSALDGNIHCDAQMPAE